MEQPNSDATSALDQLKNVRSILTDFTSRGAIGSALFCAGYRHLEGRADSIITLCNELVAKLDVEIVCADGEQLDD